MKSDQMIQIFGLTILIESSLTAVGTDAHWFSTHGYIILFMSVKSM